MNAPVIINTESAGLTSMSDTIGELAQALAKAQGSMRHAVKENVNPHFKSKYADLAGVIDACREPLALNGLSYTQLPSSSADGVVLTTILLHASGQWISSVLTVPLSKRDAQGVGSAITYARRYALAALVGIAQEDDDGNAAARRADDREDRDDSLQEKMTGLRAQIGKELDRLGLKGKPDTERAARVARPLKRMPYSGQDFETVLAALKAEPTPDGEDDYEPESDGDSRPTKR